MIWFTSDHHFYHHNIINYCHRPFHNLSDMNSKMIEYWNQNIHVNDTVYHLGDFAFWGKKLDHQELFHSLKGKKHLIQGNHDHDHVRKLPWLSISYYLELKIQEYFLILSHFPFEQWNKQYYGSIHLHGHCHGTLKRKVSHRIDVGVDTHQFKPYHLDEILQKKDCEETINTIYS